MDKKYKNEYDLLSYDIISDAVSGDEDAIYKVIEHYEGYIYYLSISKSLDKHGTTTLRINDDLRQSLKIHLIISILSFEI